MKITELLMTEALERMPAEKAGPGDIIAIAGIPEIMIGDTLADLDDPRPLPLITVDEPSISMTIGINTSPLAGRVRHKLTARLVKDRLDAELVGNVSIRVLPTERPDTWEVQGRGELQLAILVEIMRREGFELTVGKPQVVTQTIDGKLHEPVERLTIDVPEEFLGVVTQLVGTAQGSDGADGEPRHRLGPDGVHRPGPRPDRLPHRVPDRHPRHRPAPPLFEGYEPWDGELRTRPPARWSPTGAAGHAVRAGEPAGARRDVRAAGHRGVRRHDRRGELPRRRHGREHHQGEEAHQHALLDLRRAEPPDPAAPLSLEQALEFCREDECVEVTPATVRIRKVVLSAQERGRSRGAKAKQ